MADRARLISTKAVYGKPWSKITEVPITRKVLQRLGEVLVESIKEEALADFQKQMKVRTPRGKPMGLPVSKRFYDSFGYRIVGASTIDVTTTWEWFPRYEGRPPYRMTWLTREKGVHIVPFPQEDGTVIFRTAPLTTQNAWIHPGVAKFTFMQRGIRKGRQRAARIIADELKELLKRSPIS